MKGMEMKQGLLRARLLMALTVMGAALSGLGLQTAAAAPVVSQNIVSQVNAMPAATRQQTIEAEAKKEGTLTLYHVNIEDIPAMAAAFTKKYGIKVVLWRSSSETVSNRLITEALGGRFDADMIDNNGPGMEALSREKLLQPVNSPLEKELIPQAFPASKDWIATTVDVFVQAYNTNKIKKADLPKTYNDLLDPKWKGMLTVEADDQDWFEMTSEKLGKEKTHKLFQDIVAKNGISVRKGHSLLANLIVSGDVPMGLTLYGYKPEQLKKKGAPIDWFVIQPQIAQIRGIAMPKKVQHPYAALLFYDFMLTDGQQMYSDREQYPTNKKIKNHAGAMPLVYIDPARSLDEGAAWTKDYEHIITKAK
jgi:iron(III) transport system substrate-binding protein